MEEYVAAWTLDTTSLLESHAWLMTGMMDALDLTVTEAAPMSIATFSVAIPNGRKLYIGIEGTILYLGRL